MPYFWIIFSYILGSIPFGYLISILSGKNVLQIGWKKTSGSNVFKNVGKWQGVATGLLDLAKGYFVVYAAREMGFSVDIQIFSGVAAVIGHNWSFFLRFAGGRGIGTFIGAFLAFSPQILLLSIIPLFVFALIWNAAIGTLFFLLASLLVSLHFGQFATAGFFTALSLIPILIKRLSPLKEIKTARNKKNLFFNRLFFDNEEALWSLRIKRILQKEKQSPSRITKMMKYPARSVLLPTKFSWRIAKYGVGIAGRPIKKLFKTPEKAVFAITLEDFKKMMVSASKKIVLHQEEINRINVFPVADKDTGYNLAATLIGVEGAVSQKEYSNFRDLTQDIKTAAMVNARGNAGMIYTGYLIEVLDRIKHLETVDAFHLALAMKRGIRAARNSIAEPVEGTILDVIKTAGKKTFESAKMKREKNIIKVLEGAYKESLISLQQTKEKLQVLKENDVIDAGALGFVKILEAWIESLKGVPIVAKTETAGPVFLPEEELEYRYEVVFSFKKDPNADVEDLKKELSLLGGSLEVLELDDAVKIHIHTHDPGLIQDRFKKMSEFESRVEDMQAQIKKEKKQPLGLVVDEVADLPKEFLEKHGIIEVPFTARFSDGQIVVSRQEIYRKMEENLARGKPLPTTSAPSFNEFISAYRKAFERFEKILVITVSSKLSGAYSSARIARSIYKKPKKLNIYVFDCFTAEVGQALVAFRAQELISQGKETEEIVEELKHFCPRITLLGCIDDFKYAIRRGRLRLTKILAKPFYLIQKSGVKFVVGFRDGKIRFFSLTFRKDIAKILAGEINKQRKGKKARLVISHADNLQAAENLKNELEKNPDIKILFVSAVSPAVAVHVGPGAVLAAFHLDN